MNLNKIVELENEVMEGIQVVDAPMDNYEDENWQEHAKRNNVDSPSHYTQGGIECIDAIEEALTPEEFRGYCKGNAIKYIWRERHKNGDEDLAKARWYLNRLIMGMIGA